jgi:small subunit ribosomal protein S1
VDAEHRKISLSLKALASDPWQSVADRYPPETITSGLVKRITNFGAFIQLEEGVEGLAHISELSDKHVRSVGDAVREGQVVKVRVLSVDPEQRKISLSLKRTDPEAEAAAAAAAAAYAAAHPPPPPPKKKERPMRGGLAW